MFYNPRYNALKYHIDTHQNLSLNYTKLVSRLNMSTIHLPYYLFLHYSAVASVGFNPSVGGNAKRIEVFVLDFDQDVYGQSVEVLFYKKLRNEVKFDSLNALTSAIDEDVRLTQAYFAKNNAK